MPAAQSGKFADKPPVLLQHGLLSAYWDWSWDEVAAYDLPTTFQYVHDQTGQKIYYVWPFLVIGTGSITMYDYGNEEDNMKHYRQRSPPIYNMTSIPNDLPLFLGYGGQDKISDVKDVQVLLDNLKDHDVDRLVLLFRQDYVHVDFVLGVGANQVVYHPLMAFFKLN
ncbi:hypothetical protein JCGZ_13766 [Jatropha curcas]|uniref:Partial AB-hydrolase lipase domain-containing protein n=1 Tax=Jatropha curcas TaxID=180498 RepID=A0A067K741_JATCU|nr:hypothetical protein JCGZ_13766 [Jatropha curcas]